MYVEVVNWSSVSNFAIPGIFFSYEGVGLIHRPNMKGLGRVTQFLLAEAIGLLGHDGGPSLVCFSSFSLVWLSLLCFYFISLFNLSIFLLALIYLLFINVFVYWQLQKIAKNRKIWNKQKSSFRLVFG